MVTCHMDTTQAYVWSLQNFVLGEHVLTPCPENPTPVKACAISACGNFAVLGTASGWIERFNLQSGISRGAYVDLSGSSRSAHDGEVVGIACDSTNAIMISAGYHGDIKVWDFKGCKLKSRREVGSSLDKIVYNRDNGLLATVADDMVIRLFDVVALRMVRKFEGHTDRITDMCFSEDGKWLLTSSMDLTLRIWDVILARQIDVVQVDVSVTSLSLSPNMDYLATTHVDQNGVQLWVNQSMFSGSTSAEYYGSGKQIPSVSSAADTKDIDSEMATVDPPQSPVSPLSSISNQQIPGLVTLSSHPKSQWQSLLNLDIIKARNKPIEPPKKPEKVPFFLPCIPTISGEIQFTPGKHAYEEKHKEPKLNDKKRKISDTSPSQFCRFLQSAADANNFAAFTEYILSLSPSTLDLELRILQIIDHDDDEEELAERPELHYLGLLLDYFIHAISCRDNFNFLETLVILFFKIHGESIRRQSELERKAERLLEVHSPISHLLNNLFKRVQCMTMFLSNSQL